MSWQFPSDGFDYFRTMAAGAAPADGGPITIVAMVKPTAANGGIIAARVGTSYTYSLLWDTGKYFGEGDFTGGPNIDSNNWQLIAYSKAAGSATMRWHIATNLGGTVAWAHSNGGSIGDGTGPVDNLIIGLAHNRMAGFLAAAALFTTALDDAAVEALGVTSMGSWMAATPAAAWQFNTPVADPLLDLTTGHADQTAATLSPTLSGDDPPNWAYFSPIVPVSAADAFTTSDATSRAVTHPRATPDTSTAADSPTRTVALVRNSTDTVTSVESPTRTVALPRTVTDGVTTGDAPSRLLSTPRSTADSLASGDTLGRTLTLLRAPTDVWVSANVATGAIAHPRALADSWAAGDTAVAVLIPAHARNILLNLGTPQLKWTVGGGYMIPLPAISLEYVRVPVSAVAAGQPVNPTTDVVQMAFVLPGGTPQSGDWKTAGWDTGQINNVYQAQCLVGPGGVVTLPPGNYSVWVRIFDSPEIPARPAGNQLIY